MCLRPSAAAPEPRESSVNGFYFAPPAATERRPFGAEVSLALRSIACGRRNIEDGLDARVEESIQASVVATQARLCYDHFMDNLTIADETHKLIETTVLGHLAGYNVSPCNVALVDDEFGMVGISIGICYNSAGPPIHSRLTLALLSDLRAKLVAVGDWRMPFVEHYFTEDQKFEGLRRAC